MFGSIPVATEGRDPFPLGQDGGCRAAPAVGFPERRARDAGAPRPAVQPAHTASEATRSEETDREGEASIYLDPDPGTAGPGA